MKTSKPVAHNTDHNLEDCGVWLDTVKLKGNAKKRRLARPISKLLNPFTDGVGYNVAVALNFTQTKIEMPKTKQSSISNYFTNHRRVLKKMSTDVEPNTGAQEACFPSRLPSILTTNDDCDFNDEPLKCGEEGHNKLTEPLMWWEKEVGEIHPCQSVNAAKEGFQSHVLHTSKEVQTQNKENTFPMSSKKTETQSALKNTKLEQLNSPKKGSISPFKWTTPKNSPIKRRKGQSIGDSDDESLCMLFTQDTQGFRVIAHRFPQMRSPFKDQSNVSALAPSGIKCVVEDDEEVPFTQDSQGNIVIKH